MYGTKRADHLTTEKQYMALRELAYQATEEEFPEIQVKDVRYSDAQTADKWKNLNDRAARFHRATWDWVEAYPTYKNQPNRFEISIWKGATLGALCFGKLSQSANRVRMNLIEATPLIPNPLGMRALPILSFAAAAFADLVGATEIWVLDPDPNLEEVYKKEGFSNRHAYHGKRIGQMRRLL